MFEPSQNAATEVLRSFLPKAAREYAVTRNFDHGMGQHDNVSAISPWVRLRVLPEWQVIEEVLKIHSPSEASKFIDEVCWRTYWKGWLQRRPSVWTDYCEELKIAKVQLVDSSKYHSVIKAASSIDCMDSWTKELIETGYLHNHARMWYASIWIHTLKLPWVLGAEFFLKHLLDGDAASNTLSWRWVAGLHTNGKTYLASASNIEKYTNGRFTVSAKLANQAVEIKESRPKPPALPVKALDPLPSAGRIGLLIHEEDLSAASWLADKVDVAAVAGLLPIEAYQSHSIAKSVIEFREACMKSTLNKSDSFCSSLDQVVDWASEAKLDSVIMPEVPVGLWNEVLPELKNALSERCIQLRTTRHWWDEHFYPHAQAGFFRFKKAIPSALDQINQPLLAL